MYKFAENPFHLRHHILFISKRHLKPDVWTNSVSGSAKVRDKRYSTGCQSLEDHTSTEFADGWKHQNVGRPQLPHGFKMSQLSPE